MNYFSKCSQILDSIPLHKNVLDVIKSLLPNNFLTIEKTKWWKVHFSNIDVQKQMEKDCFNSFMEYDEDEDIGIEESIKKWAEINGCRTIDRYINTWEFAIDCGGTKYFIVFEPKNSIPLLVVECDDSSEYISRIYNVHRFSNWVNSVPYNFRDVELNSYECEEIITEGIDNHTEDDDEFSIMFLIIISLISKLSCVNLI